MGGLGAWGHGDWETRDLRTKTYIRGHGMGLGLEEKDETIL